MKNLNAFILEKLVISRDIKRTSDKVWLILYKYDFDINGFVWKELDTNSFDEVLDNVNKYGEIYAVYKDVPKNKTIIDEILKAAKDVKFGDISYGIFNNILKKHNVGSIGRDSILKMIKDR